MAIDESITLKKLEVFLAFMERNNLARVAEDLGQSVVSVHRALHSLEQAIGCPLFKLEGRNLVPQDTARRLAESARRVVAECEDGIHAVRDMAGINASRLRLGAIYSLTLHCIPHLIVGTKLRKDGLNIELTLGSNDELLQKLQDGRLDAIVIGVHDGIDSKRLITVPLFSDEMFLAVPLDSPYASRTTVDLQELASENFVTLADGFITSFSFNRMMEHAGISPVIGMHVGDIFSLINLVSNGMGISLLPGRIASFTPRIKLIPLSSDHTYSQHIALLFLDSREQDRNLLALAAEGRTYSRRLLQGADFPMLGEVE